MRLILIFSFILSLQSAAWAKSPKKQEDIKRGSITYILTSMIFDIDTWIGGSGLPIFFERCHTISSDRKISPRYSRLGACLWYFYHENDGRKGDYIFAQGRFVTDRSLFSVKIQWRALTLSKLWKAWWHEDPRYLETLVKVEGLAPEAFLEKLVSEYMVYQDHLEQKNKEKEIREEKATNRLSSELTQEPGIGRELFKRMILEMKSWQANYFLFKLSPVENKKINSFKIGIGNESEELYFLNGSTNYYPRSEDYFFRLD